MTTSDDFGLWPTPTSALAEKGIRTQEGAEREYERKGEGADLETVVKARPGLWPTPDASMASGGRTFKPGTVSETGKDLRTGRKRSVPLNAAVAGGLVSTSQPSAQLTLFAEDSPASRSARPGSDLARRTTELSGLKCSESFGKYLPDGSLVRMLLESSAWNSTRCYLTWKDSATPQKRLYFRLVPSMPHTDETEFGFLATATATANQLAPSMKKHPGVRRWMMPTPTASDHIERESTSAEKVNPLTGKSASPEWLAKRLADPKGKSLPMTGNQTESQPGSLNPQWVEWLMGFPAGWTDLEPSETP